METLRSRKVDSVNILEFFLTALLDLHINSKIRVTLLFGRPKYEQH